MQKVELKKKKYQNNVVNEYEKYPKNLLSYEFQSRMNMNDLKRFEDVGRQLQNKVNKK